jgi:hypothetical protein
MESTTNNNIALATVVVQCSVGSFAANQSLVFRINIYLRQARNPEQKGYNDRTQLS